ncbi:MAG: sigma-70 family RNA polymerase sigma factor [Kofleriaceae bacterium]
MGESGRTNAEELLVHASWLRGLALRLVRDADVADDLVQDTWVATIRRAPETGEPVKPWLATVLLNALRMRLRGEGRRSMREQATLLAGDEVPSPEVMVARAEAQRTLVDLVLRLDEPLRDVVLLHFCEGITLADIARAQGIPAGTVRWRLKTALDQLRAKLDAEPGGRKRWAIAWLATPKGVLVAHKTTKVAVVIAILLLLLVGVAVMQKRSHSDGDDAALAGDPAGRPKPTTAVTGTDPSEAGGANELAWLGQRGVQPRRIAGRVTFRGSAVAGASVELASLASESGAVAAPRVVTTAAGEFDFGPQRAMEWSVRATAPGKTGTAIAIDLRNPTTRPPPDHLELALGACDAAMVGTVRDASGGPIAKARLANLETAGLSAVPGGAAVTSDAAGAYELCIETRWPGWTSVEISAAGYGSIVYTNIIAGRVRIDFALVPEATIVGRVIRDDTGEPVASAHVFVPGGRALQLETTAWRGTFSDAQGRFRLDRVAPGRHLVQARAEGMVASTRGTPVIVAAGETTPEIEIRLEAGSRIQGVVREGSTPVAGARVATTAVASRTAVSQDDGSFVLDEVPRGELGFKAPPFDVISPKSLVVSEPEHAVVIEVEQLGGIIGRVVRGKDPVAGTHVYIRGPNDFDLGTIRSDATGRFEARGLRPGPWTVGAADERVGSFGFADTVQLGRGETKEITVELAYSASIAGRVVDQNGAPVAGVSVDFRHSTTDDAGYTVTATDGTYRAATMTGGGQYRPRVRLNQLASAALRPAGGTEFPLVTVPGPDSAITDVVLAVQLDRLAIAGKVFDAAGAPVADARVVAELVEPGQEPRFIRGDRGGLQDPATTTDVDGRFSIAELSAGNYTVQASSSAGGEVMATGVRAGRSDLTLVLAMSGTIEGTLAGFKATPQVTATRSGPGGAHAPAAATVTGTSFAIRDLTPGSYQVTARTPTEAASTVVEVISGRTARTTLTSRGSGSIAGRVREFRTGAPIQGMTCRAMPRAGDAQSTGASGEGARTDAQGAFVLATAPAGDIVVTCTGLSQLYSDGLRLVTLVASQRLDVDVPVVAWREESARTISGFGATIDLQALTPRLTRVRPGGAAATAGFQDGDVVTAIDGASVSQLSPSAVWILIANRTAGTTVKVTVTRPGKTFTADLVLRDSEAQ